MTEGLMEVVESYSELDARGVPEDPYEAAALEFHKNNPHVFQEIVELCLRLKQAGRTRWSISAAFEVVRYNHAITTEAEHYKLNNSHRPFYARWVMRDVPELEGFFETRERGGERNYDYIY